MLAGRLDKRITIQVSTSDSRDSFGDSTPAWTDLATVWAEIVPISGREFWAAQAVNAEKDLRITIRYRDDITPKNRIVYGSRVFDIQSVIDMRGMREELQIMCREEL